MENPETEKSERKQLMMKKTLAFSIEFGFMIIIPLLVFAFLGKWFAARHNNMIFFYAGILLALLTSTIWFYKRINDIYKDFLK